MRDVWILALAQACSACGTIMLATFGGIIGTELAPFPAMATLPLSLTVLGVAFGSIPAAMLMQRIGRKAAFVGSALMATVAALLCAVSVASAAFAGLCVAGFLLGVNMAFVQQYRFAATEFVGEAQAGRAVSTVMLGSWPRRCSRRSSGTARACWANGRSSRARSWPSPACAGSRRSCC